jgi:adhesin transport system membrane fusion protein
MAMVGVMLLFLATALAWAALAQLDVAVQARGSVVPPSRLQEVASLEGGLVQELLVQPGQRVHKGDPLARLDTAQAQASLGENRQQRLAALAGRARADALLAGTAPRFEEAWAREAPALIDKEAQLWRDALAEHRAAVAAAREGIERRRGELVEAQARIAALQGTVKVAQESFQIEERLVREGAGARADMLQAQQRLLAQQAELDGLQQSLPRLRAQVSEAQSQAVEIESRTRAQWGQQRSEFEAKAAALGAVQGGHEDRLSRREVFAPMDGVVNRVLVPTLGGVAAPGKPIVEIVPDEAQLLMALRVKPADIGFIREGQDANVRVLAYDAATYGQMQAKVLRVGADAVLDEKGEPYFEVHLGAARDQIQLHGRPLPVSPGMPVDAGVLTGQRSVLQYLMKPVLRGIQGALQER